MSNALLAILKSWRANSISAKAKISRKQISGEEALNLQASVNRGETSHIILTGKHSYCIDNVEIKSWGEGAHLFIGSFCSIAANLRVYLGGNHRTDWLTTYPFGHMNVEKFPSGRVHGYLHPTTKGHVIIENDVWIGDNCTIMSGLTIGSGSVIAANSVVSKNVEPYTIVGGNPARLIKRRYQDDITARLLRIKWWEWEDSVIDAVIPILQQPLTLDTLAILEDQYVALRS